LKIIINPQQNKLQNSDNSIFKGREENGRKGRGWGKKKRKRGEGSFVRPKF